MNRVHKLKTVQPYFDKVLLGKKKWEMRKNDRDYQEGDYLLLEEFINGKLTGNSFRVQIESIESVSFEMGLRENFTMLNLDWEVKGIAKVKHKETGRIGLVDFEDYVRIRDKDKSGYHSVGVKWTGNKNNKYTHIRDLDVISINHEFGCHDEIIEPIQEKKIHSRCALN